MKLMDIEKIQDKDIKAEIEFLRSRWKSLLLDCKNSCRLKSCYQYCEDCSLNKRRDGGCTLVRDYDILKENGLL